MLNGRVGFLYNTTATSAEKDDTYIHYTHNYIYYTVVRFNDVNIFRVGFMRRMISSQI